MNLGTALTTLLDATAEMVNDPIICRARKRVATKAESMRLRRERQAALLQERLNSMIRVSGETECEVCSRLFKHHPYFNGHKIDDGTGRKVPWLRESCKGHLMKL